MEINYLLKLVYYLKTGLCIFNVFNNNVLNLLKKKRTNLLDLLTELNNLFRNRNKLIFIYLNHKVILAFYSFVLNLDIVNLLTINFIN